MQTLLVSLLFVSSSLYACDTTLAVETDDPVRPAWIWATADRHESQIIEIRKSFRIDGPVQRADLRLAAEFASCELRLGDRTVLTLDDYGPWLDLDLTEHVRTGEDLLELRCTGSAGPSAVLLELTIVMVDGRRTVLHSEADWQARVVDGTPMDWTLAREFGAVATEFWDADRTARITAFDNYEQWRQASDGNTATNAAKFVVRPGFEIERIHSAAEQDGSWVSLEIDPQGRLTIGREDRGLLQMTLADNGRSVAQIETIDDTLQECRGLLYADGSLFAQANNSKGLYRLDDESNAPALVREFPGGVGHGRNDLALGPDKAIYAIFGDSVSLPTENVVDLTSPFREARHGQSTTEGHVLRYAPATGQWDLFCSGLRNPFGIAFNTDGEAFTYDADAEFDMGAPWYRPTRLVHLVSGGDYGWRGRTGTWPPYDSDHAGDTLPTGNIGKGSPTAVKSGAKSAFPEHYRRAMFALDWAYGRILACHLIPRGAGYVCRTETFLKGRPLNVTDLDFGPDGSMYVITGGRKTHSDLYRITWSGKTTPPRKPTTQQVARSRFSQSQRDKRTRLSAFHGQPESLEAMTDAWKQIGSADPMLRDAARVVLEHQPVETWIHRAVQETRPAWVVSAMLSASRSDQDELIPRILKKLVDIPYERLSGYDRATLLEIWSRCLFKPAAKQAPAFTATVNRIRAWYPELSAPVFAPTGAGRGVNHQLALLAAQLGTPDLIPKTLDYLARADTQEDRIHAVFVLRNRRDGWTTESRRTVFETLSDLDRTVTGGAGMPGFLKRIREELIETLTPAEAALLAELMRSGAEVLPPELSIDRPIVKKWQVDDLKTLLAGTSTPPDHKRGQKLFRTVLCHRCHRVGTSGGVTGPNLTSVAGRFGRRDILLSILEPSRVVDEKYRSQQIVTIDGRVISGRIVTGGDYRSQKLSLAIDPLQPGQIVEIDKSEIETHQASLLSPMPAGLLDTLTPDDVRDLLAFLEHAAFR